MGALRPVKAVVTGSASLLRFFDLAVRRHRSFMVYAIDSLPGLHGAPCRRDVIYATVYLNKKQRASHICEKW
jgi:hypothetical protein